MSLSVTTNRNTYTGTGAVSVYSFTYMIFAHTDLVVTQRSTSGTESVLVLNSQYTVQYDTTDRLESGGTITLSSPLPADYTLVIERIRPLTQSTQFRAQSQFYPETHEDTFDHGMMVSQQQQDALDRAVILPTTVTPASFDPTLPDDISEASSANRLIAVNSGSDGFVMSSTVAEIIASALGGGGAEFQLYLEPTGVAATDTANLQDALDTAKASGTPIWLGEGTFVVNQTLTYSATAPQHGPTIIGCGGRSTFIQNEIGTAGARILSMIPGTPDDPAQWPFVYHTNISGIGFIGPTVAAAARQGGIRISAQQQTVIKDCTFQDFAGTGLTILNNTGDSSQVVFLELDNCWFNNCNEWGFDTGEQALGAAKIQNCNFARCGGGIRMKGFFSTIEHCGFSYTERWEGLRIDYRGGATSRQITVRGCGFEGCANGDIRCHGHGHHFHQNDHADALSGNTEIDMYGVQVGDLHAATNGTGDSLSVPDANGYVTLNCALASFPATMPSSTIFIQSASNASNNGSFICQTRPSATQLTFYNPDGVAETSSFEWYVGFVSSQPVRVSQHNMRITAGGGPLRATYYDAYRVGPNSRIYISDPAYQVFSGANPNLVKYAFNASAESAWVEDLTGVIQGRPPWRKKTVTTVVGYYEPDLTNDGNNFRLEVYVGTGTDVSAPDGSNKQTLTAAVAYFTADNVGQRIVISGMTDPNNDGVFTITDFVDASNIKYTNAPGSAETSSFTWSFRDLEILAPIVVPTAYEGQPVWFQLKNDATHNVDVTWTGFALVNGGIDYITAQTRLGVAMHFDDASGWIKWSEWRSNSLPSSTHRSWCTMRRTSSTPPVMALTTTPQDILGAWVGDESVDGIFERTGGSSHQCTYHGTRTRYVRITGSLSFDNVSNIYPITVGILKNGSTTFETDSQMPIPVTDTTYVPTATALSYCVNVDYTMQMQTGDYVSIGAMASAAENATCRRGSVTFETLDGYDGG